MDEVALHRVIDELEPLSRRFVDAGHHLYLVGGVVRDLVRGDALHGDVDLTTDAPPDVTRRLVSPLATALWTQGERFGTIGAQVGVHSVEITTHRAESYLADSRKPEVAFGTDLRVDLSRRDFTINAMAVELPTGRLIDPFDGMRDLRERRLRTPLDPQVSFSDDPLRMLRAARFVARFDLEPDPELVAVATASAHRLAIVSVERIHDELERLLAVPDPRPGIRLLLGTDLLSQVLPSVVAAGAHPDDRFAGTLRLDVALGALAGVTGPAGRRALLLWPVAEAEGTDGVDRVTRHLRYSTAERDRTRRLTGAVCEVLRAEGPPAALVRSMTVALGPDVDLLWPAVDALARQRPVIDLRRRLLEVLETRRALTGSGELARLEPPVDGRTVMSHLGCPPGPVVGQALAALRSEIVRHGPIDERQALDLLDRWWASREA